MSDQPATDATTADDVRWYLPDGVRERLSDREIERVIAAMPRRAPMYVAHAIKAALQRIDSGVDNG